VRSFPWFLLLGLATALAGGSLLAGGDDGDAAGGERLGRVERVVDGDTVRVRIDGGRRETVRLIGIDTPESVTPDRPVECFGPAAARFTRRELDGRRVRLVLDAEPRDRFDRLLAYVFRRDDGRFVNLAIVRGGFAQPLTIAPNVRYADRFREAAREARAAGRGLWGACSG
jgi:micrococcal nuclease